MYELKKNGKVFTSKFVVTGPSSYKKKEFTGPRSHKCWETLVYTMVSPIEDMQSKNGDLSVKQTSAIHKAEKFSLIPTKAGSLFYQ